MRFSFGRDERKWLYIAVKLNHSLVFVEENCVERDAEERMDRDDLFIRKRKDQRPGQFLPEHDPDCSLERRIREFIVL